MRAAWSAHPTSMAATHPNADSIAADSSITYSCTKQKSGCRAVHGKSAVAAQLSAKTICVRVIWFFSTPRAADFHMWASIWALSASFMHPAAAVRYAWKACRTTTGAATTTAHDALFLIASSTRRLDGFGELEHRHGVVITVVIARNHLKVVVYQPPFLAFRRSKINQSGKASGG